MQEEPVLYIIMRNDLDSLNPGKACAQAAHAANHAQSVIDSEDTSTDNPHVQNLFALWKNTTDQYFGTTIVLQANIDQIYRVHDDVRQYEKVMTGIIHDPTYPLRDGETTHLIPLDTCMWIFGDHTDYNLTGYLSFLNLMD